MVKRSLRTTAVIGFISKGLIYVVVGVLSLLAALNLGGQSSGTNQAFIFLKQQVFGQVLLMALGVGLLCYSIWMFVRCFVDPENVGADLNSKFIRFGFLTTGLVYTFLAVLAFYHLFSSQKEDYGAKYLEYLGPSLLTIIFICIGIVLAIQAVILCVGVFRGGVLDQFNLEGRKGSGFIRMGGKFGFYSRAFIVAIIAYFFLRAGIYSRTHEIMGIQDAFSFLDQSSLGRILMGITAIGFISYGLFYILLSKYRKFE